MKNASTLLFLFPFFPFQLYFAEKLLSSCSYALQVAKFFEFVKKKKEDSAFDENALKVNQQQLLLPHKGLWVPERKDLPESLRSLDFRTVSFSH